MLLNRIAIALCGILFFCGVVLCVSDSQNVLWPLVGIVFIGVSSYGIKCFADRDEKISRALDEEN